MVAIRDAWCAVVRLWDTIEEFDDPGFQRILGAYDQKLVPLNTFFEDGRSPPQLVGGYSNVGPDGVPRQFIVVVSELRRQQLFNRGSNAIDD